MSRRDFVTESARAAVAAAIVPRSVLGGPGHLAPSDRLNIAIVGAGGMGMSNAQQLTSENLVALVDVDFAFVDRRLAERLKDRDKKPKEEQESLDRLSAAFTAARRYADFRELLAREKDLDAVVVATPDHLHAVIAAAAMKAGKHVYVQKPLTYSVHEARALADLARKTRVATQMGNQGHSSDDARRVNEWIQAGVIGQVREVHVWTNRPIWPQGLPRPAATPAEVAATNWGRGGVATRMANALGGSHAPPAGLSWDLFLGPAPDVAYHPIYHPFNWRGWTDWGVGALGDMGAHLVDHPYWALGLGYPTSIEATSTPWGGPQDRPATYPLAMVAHYNFPARGGQPPVRLSWYDGGLMPPRHPLLPFDLVLNREGGVMFVGERGILLHETYGANPRMLPEPLMDEAQAVPRTLPRVDTTHELNWVNAAKGNGQAVSPFEYAAPLTEVMLLGLVALRAGQGRKIFYDGASMKVTNVPEANAFLTREYRPGWSL